MKKIALTLFCIFLCASALIAEPAVRTLDETRPGSVLVVYLSGSPGFPEGSLEFSNGRRIDASSFAVDETRVILFGVPCNVPAGPAILTLTGETGGTRYTVEREVLILDRDFRSETIPLNERLTRLREDENEARQRQARELYDLLITFHRESVFDPGPYGEPVAGARITSWFGDRRTYRYSDGSETGSIHSGIDLAASPGTEVFSSGNGTVAFVGDRIITGKTVVVEQGPGVYCLYYHLKDSFVEAGEAVYAGQVIGTVGMTGLATGPHLHWEIRVGGVPVDPSELTAASLLDKDRVISKIDQSD